MTYPLVTELADDGISVSLSCATLGFSRQAYYAWRADPVTQRDWTDAHLVNDLIDLHAEVPEFGYRLLADELGDAGWDVSENRVHRLCSEHGITSTTQRSGRGKASRPGPPAHDDHVQRDFDAPAPDRTWFTDITEHPTGEGKLYLCAFKDACSNRIVGYAMSDRMTAELADAALRTALARRRPDGSIEIIVHSDRGSQFRSLLFLSTLADNGLVGSMGQVGAAADNAAMESFFSLLQKNVLDRQEWDTREQLRVAITVWIERTYNRRRRQRALGRMTPVEFETVINHNDPYLAPVAA